MSGGTLDPLTALELQQNQESAFGVIPTYVAPIDLDPNVGIGFQEPFGTSITGPSFKSTYTTIEALTQNLKNLLLTHKGERLLNPTFGSRLREILFEPNIDTIVIDIQDAIKEAVADWMEYITIRNIEVNRFNDDGSTGANIFVTVTFSPDVYAGANTEAASLGIPLQVNDFEGNMNSPHLGGTAEQNMALSNDFLSGGGGGY